MASHLEFSRINSWWKECVIFFFLFFFKNFWISQSNQRNFDHPQMPKGHSCQGKIGILEHKLSHFLAVTSLHINRFGVSQIFGVGRCFHQS